MTKIPKPKIPQPLKKPRRTVMDKVAERLQQQVEVSGLVIKELLDLLVLDETRTTEQVMINKRRRELLKKLEQLDYEHLDFATIAKLYKFMADADGVDMRFLDGAKNE